MPQSRRTLFAALALLLLAGLPAAADTTAPTTSDTKLLRFPDIHGDTVVFTYAGDLWKAPTAGGTAVRLTAHPGVEVFGRFSPDGNWIAFTGQYDGDEQVYVMPAAGGVPRQLTFYPAHGPLTPRWGYDDQVYGWTPDGKWVLFRSLRDAKDIGDGRLYKVSVDGGLPVALPMPESGAGDYSPDGKKIVYSPLFRDFRSWKRYQGGWAQDLFIFDLTTFDTERITDNPRTDRDPMWIGDKIYFVSDRTGTLNLYSYDLATKATAQLTDGTTADLRWPAADEQGRIVYELAGELWEYDTDGGANHRIPIQVPSDGLWDRPGRASAADQIEDFELSPEGARALFVARGDVFTAPAEKGPTRNLTDSSGAHEREARWSPDGAQVVYISDRSGEEELYLEAQDGSGTARQLTHDGHVRRYNPQWSPDGKRIAFNDKDGKLYSVTVADGAVTQVAQDVQGNVFDYAWSPDGAYLAFSLSEDTGFRALWIWGAADGALHRVTSPMFNVGNPAWDPKGKYLYYLSDREFAPQLAHFEWNYAVNRETYIYALALTRDTPSPFPSQSDEVKVAKADEGGGAKDAKKGADKGKSADKDKAAKGDEEKKPEKVVVKIDFDGLAERLARVPVDADNYGALVATEGHLLYIRSDAGFYGRERARKPALMIYSLDDRKEGTVAGDVDAFAVSRDGKKVLIQHHGSYDLYDAVADAKDPKSISTAGLQVDRVPRQEWTEIFDEVWRRFRDYFYVANMNGYDWQAIGDRYRQLLPYVGHRSDLNYVISEMIGELNNSHSYIQGGDFDMPERPEVALPGARFTADPASGRYRISRILSGDNAEDRYRAPLTEIGVDARQADYLLAIDGEDVKTTDNPYRLLRYKADRPVELTLNDRPVADGARKVTFKPITDEESLFYLDWVETNRKRVDETSGGKIGYLHVPDMGADGIREFIKAFYPQVRKQGLIVDVRFNGGGNVSQMLIERLSRKLLAVGYSRTSQVTETYPDVVFHGPLAALCNETTASDGDIFSAMFKQAGLGPLIGKRSWGGVVGITDHGALLDGGHVFVPQFATASVDGKWIIEGHGVDPDIVVENTPKEVLAGHDPQLERAIQEVMAKIAANPPTLPPEPAPPVRTQ
jgi:tricorn protease